MGEWKSVRIGDVLKEVSRETRLDPSTKYRLLGVKWYGKGVFLREEKYGKEIKATKLYEVKQGDFIYNRLFAWKSSFAIIPDEFDGCLVSNEFPLFTCCEGKLLPEFLLSYMLLPENIASVNNLSGGMSSVSRKRFKEKDFLNFEVPQYDIEIQSRICQRLKKMSELSITQDLESAHQISLIKQLRQRILQDAIEGKLTAKWRDKHPELVRGDNHASKLLEKIKAEKERLTKITKITKKAKALPLISEEEKPFDLPEGWVWCRLKEVAQGFEYGSSEKSIKTGKVPVLRMGNLQNGVIVWENLVYTNDDGEIEQYLLKPEDLLFNRTNSRELVGKTAIFDCEEKAIYAGYIVRFHMCDKINARFANYVMNSTYHRKWCDKVKADALGQSNINATKLREFIFPLSPLAEQQAIVERVDKLMTTIDELEKQVSERKEQSEMLMQSVLREAFAIG